MFWIMCSLFTFFLRLESEVLHLIQPSLSRTVHMLQQLLVTVHVQNHDILIDGLLFNITF